MLQDEIQKTVRQVKTDAYQMSIGEIVNMYKDGELLINPDFQRLFRWGIGQKSKLIESILLGIPLPSIFVFETSDSKWELVDGLQRISTILEFMGVLIDPETKRERVPSILVGTKYLPSLESVVWEKTNRISDINEDQQKELDKTLQLSIRRARLSVEILKRPSDNDIKYDLFQRLNAGGTPANAQELRNCIIIMVNREYYNFMVDLEKDNHFTNVIDVSSEQNTKQKAMEYVSRFLVHAFIPFNNKLDVEEYVDEGIITLATKNETTRAKDMFKNTFSLLNNAYGKDSFKRIENGQHVGRNSLAAFECIAVGIAKNIDHILSKPNPQEYIKKRIEEFWNNSEISSFFAPGLRGTTRLQRTLAFGSSWFST